VPVFHDDARVFSAVTLMFLKSPIVFSAVTLMFLKSPFVFSAVTLKTSP
jgi:hypothetical protein